MRRAFTLVEVLVVIGIILVLIGLVLLLYPSREKRHVTDAASDLQSYITGAKTRALRDNRPIGIRLLSSDGFVTFDSVQLIEGSSVFAPINPGSPANSSAPMNVYLDLPAGNDIQKRINQNPNLDPESLNVARQVGIQLKGNVEVGDMLEIVDVTPSIHRIITIDYSTNTMRLAATKEAIDNDKDGVVDYWFVHGVPNVNATASARLGYNYRYLRKPRPLLGDKPYRLSEGVYVSRMTGSIPSSVNVPQNYEIIFSPSGQVINSSSGRIVLWLADRNNAAEPKLLCIYVSTGACVVHPVGPPGNEFAYTQDGR